MTVEVGQSTANDASQIFVANPNNSASCSMEQIYSPISINKSYNSMAPGFMTPFTRDFGPFNNGTSIGPTIRELNPYFSNIFGDNGSNFIGNCDYNVVSHYPGEDLNLKKNQNRYGITEVRTQALRGPLMLSGWGFDIADLPVPSMSSNLRQFDPNLVNNRAYWKTGPVHLMWDDERQIWCGGYQIVCGVLKGPITSGSPSSPSLFTVKILRIASKASNFVATYQTLDTNLGEEITCVNRYKDLIFEPTEEELENEEIFVICARINYEWVLISFYKESSNTYIGTFRGQWNKGQDKIVTQLKPSTTTTIQVEVKNYFATIGKNNVDTNCAYVKIKSEYFLIAAECNL